MNKTIPSKLAASALAIGLLLAVRAASAHTDVYFSVGVPIQSSPIYPGPAPIYVHPAAPRGLYPAPQVLYPSAPTVYVSPGYGYGSPWEQQRAWRDDQWRQQQWREKQWREQQWRENEGRDHHWQGSGDHHRRDWQGEDRDDD